MEAEQKTYPVQSAAATLIVVQALAAVVRGPAEDVQDLELPAPAHVPEAQSAYANGVDTVDP